MTINLEKELIRQNKIILSNSELLKVAEYERQPTLTENTILQRLGINETILTGREIKKKLNDKIEQTKKFNQERVFHISQIKALCLKYYLRFLQVEYYKGAIDEHLPFKIGTFEHAHGITLNKNNTYIVAPPESFKLEERPKDPLMFYKINSEYFYLVHKWGNDLSITQRLKSVFSTGYSVFLLTFFVAMIIGYVIGYGIPHENSYEIEDHIATNLLIVFLSLLSSGFGVLMNECRGFYPENEWESEFES